MRKFIVILLIALFATACCTSCTQNQRAKSWGGNATVKVPEGTEFVNVTWKNDNLWVLVKDLKTGDYKFYEESSWGLLEGTYTIKD